jgi:PPM family protein phosphatase
MVSLSTPCSSSLIQPGEPFIIEGFTVIVQSYQGRLADVSYFTVELRSTTDSEPTDSEPTDSEPTAALLRVGNPDGELHRELQIREVLKDYKLISQIWASTTQEVQVSTHAIALSSEEENTAELDEGLPEPEEIECETTEEEFLNEEYLDEEYLDEPTELQPSGAKLILLSELPDPSNTLEAWLQQQHSIEDILSFVIQLCQFFRYLSQRDWCSPQILPRYIQVGVPIRIFDLTNIHPTGQLLPSGIVTHYSAPEMVYSKPIVNETLSTYTIGALLYHLVHHQPPGIPGLEIDHLETAIAPIPSLHQILKICLSQTPEDRFPLAQLLSLLLETRQSFRVPVVRWQAIGQSTVGLSIGRLQNEDSYGIRQHHTSNGESLILGIVADGMGGMAQGEVASKLAVQTSLEAPIPADLTKPEHCSEWLLSLAQQVNESVTTHVRDGGTTLSLVVAIQQKLWIAHVGDSRIYLLRKGRICQISEDHSLVSMLLASGQITYEDSQNHPDKNVLTKSIGSKPRLSDGYVQTLSRFGEANHLTLEDGDILLLCSDGVWDLVSPADMAEIFDSENRIQTGVNRAIAQVLTQGAHDNATLLALQCHIQYPQQLYF